MNMRTEVISLSPARSISRGDWIETPTIDQEELFVILRKKYGPFWGRMKTLDGDCDGWIFEPRRQHADSTQFYACVQLDCISTISSARMIELSDNRTTNPPVTRQRNAT